MIATKKRMRNDFIKAFEKYAHRSSKDCEIDLRDDLEITASFYYQSLSGEEKSNHNTYHKLYDYAVAQKEAEKKAKEVK